ncbi:hypothetical protein [Aquicella lusitana]|uniref:Uncharacterized protein n=1 Tax=Aquicella lusitana TaxID=254246 RepID=A0A370GMN2_9COXI|nr:hypothetical protein [Aquicella lusitana]RDI44536.1 hypothetical protein C8D86_10918 [Aquicella lusitana]VVC72522.1 hypothetical protein AQULUS_02340 [Aquicella lusitana]
MRWRKTSNLIIAIILSIAYTIVSFLNIIGPLHMDATGTMNEPGPLSVYTIIYWLVSLAVTWGIYFYWRKKPELLFFTLLILGIVIIVAEIFLWGWMGSAS